MTAISGVEEIVRDRRLRGLGLLPVALHDHVASGQHFAIGRDVHGASDDGCARTIQHRCSVSRAEVVPLFAATVNREQRSGLGQAVNLYKLPTKFCFATLNGAGGRRSTGDNDANSSGARDWTVPFGSCVEDGVEDCGSCAHQRHALRFNPVENFCAINFSQNDMSNTHSGGGVQHSPPVAVELGEGVQVNVTVVNAHVPAENRSIEPHIAMCELHAFRASRCS